VTHSVIGSIAAAYWRSKPVQGASQEAITDEDTGSEVF
jgi:hypothetical protein